MRIPIKIECGCGQRYAFEVEPVAGHMPSTVACPSCGADGTKAANAIIAQNIPAQPARVSAPAVAVPLPVTRVSVAQPVAAEAPVAALAPPRRAMPGYGQIDRTQVEHEARAKIFWGDPPEEVTKYLMMQGIGYEEAAGLVQSMFQERAATLRGIGIRKTVIGSALVTVPIIAYFIFASVGVIPIKLFAVTIMVGLWGGWMVLRGSIMLLAPKFESGDVADQ